MDERLYRIYQQLLFEYGDPVVYWPQWCAKYKSIAEREKIIIGMVLVQRTTWHNAEMALRNLKKENLLGVDKIAKIKSIDLLTKLIRTAGFYQSKPKRLVGLCNFIPPSRKTEDFQSSAG